MSKSIEKFKLEEKVRLSFLRNRGSIAKISRELSLDYEYTRNIIRKFKGELTRDTRSMVANRLYEELMFGRRSRIQNLMDMLGALKEREQLYLSVCCDAPVRLHTEIDGHDIPETHECIQCHDRCEVKLVDRLHIIRTKQDILKQLLEEDDKLTEFAYKFGFTTAPPPPPPTIGNYKPNILVIGDGKQKKIIEDASKLTPLDRETIINTLEKKIWEESEDIEVAVEGKMEENVEENKQGSS